MAPAVYVIVRKLEYFAQGGSMKHLTDIQAMLRVSPDLIDIPVLDAFVTQRGLAREWNQATAAG